MQTACCSISRILYVGTNETPTPKPTVKETKPVVIARNPNSPAQLSHRLSHLNRDWDTRPRSHQEDDLRKPRRENKRSITAARREATRYAARFKEAERGKKEADRLEKEREAKRNELKKIMDALFSFFD